MQVCVLGSGIVGATCAVRLVESFPACRIVVVSKESSPDTTGDGAAGFWEPHLIKDTPPERVVKWSEDTYKLCEQLWRCPEALGSIASLKKAVSLVPAVQIWPKSSPDAGKRPPWSHIVYDFHLLDEATVDKMGYGPNCVGYAYNSYTFEPAIALPLMYAFLKSRGVHFIQRDVASLGDIDDFDYVINCSGSGAARLVPDPNVQPISGHVLRVEAPWIHRFIAKGDAYIIPNRRSVVLGSVDTPNNWNRTPVPGDKERIFRQCVDLCPALKGAKIVGSWVGLRPFRKGGVRLEMEEQETKSGKKTKIVHNYGHGGSGITLCWGCAKEVCEIISQDLAKSKM